MLGREFKDSNNLFFSDTGVPFHKLFHSGAVSEVLEEGADGKAGSFEYPSAAQLAGQTLNHTTL